MDNEVQHKLAESLTADTTSIIPFISYLLQDFWELGSSPADMTELIKKNVDTETHNRFFDLGCGKGAVAITLAQNFGVHIRGIDIMSEFINEARCKAKECGVADLTRFECDNIIAAIRGAQDYDCVIYGAVSRVLGDPLDLLTQLSQCIRLGGYILLDDAYIEDDSQNLNIHSDTKYLPLSVWHHAFDAHDLDVVACITSSNTTENISEDYDEELRWIEKRALELTKKHPQHKEMFEHYVANQRNEYDDLLGDVVGATWLLRK